MRISQSSTARPSYTDRNPLLISTVGYHAVNIAPHGTTTRATYTVPANRKAQCVAANASVLRITAAAPVGKAFIWFTRVAQAGAFIAAIFDNTVGAKDRASIGTAFFGAAGDQFQIISSDASTGGTCDYDALMDIIEFDA